MEPLYISVIGGTQEVRSAGISIKGLKLSHADHIVDSFSTRGDRARNKAMVDFLASDYNRLCLLDADQLFPEDSIERLRAHDLDIVNGLYFRRSFPVLPVAWMPTNEWPPCILYQYPRNSLVEIGGTGFGFLIIRRVVLEDMRSGMLKPKEDFVVNGPYFERTGDWHAIGADLRFFDMCRRLGHKVWLDTSIRAGHFAEIPISEKQYEGQGGVVPIRAALEEVIRQRIERGYGMAKEVLEIERDRLLAELAVEQAKAKEATDKILKLQGAIEEIERLIELGSAK